MRRQIMSVIPVLALLASFSFAAQTWTVDPPGQPWVFSSDEGGTTSYLGVDIADVTTERLSALKLKPDFGEAYGDLAFAASQNNEPGLALKALDARAKLLPESPITYFMRASAYDHLLDVKKAVANYHLFLQSANGKYPEQEWQAKHRLIALESKNK